MRTLLFLLAGLCFLMPAACDDSSTTNNQTQTYTVSGVLYDATGDVPLTNAEVTLTVGDTVLTAYTYDGGDGSYTFEGVPQLGLAYLSYEHHSHIIADHTMNLDGYLQARSTQVQLPAVWLPSASGRFRFQLLDSGGEPVTQTTLSLTMESSWLTEDASGVLIPMGELVSLSTTNNLGIAEFIDLPVPGPVGAEYLDTVSVHIPALDLDDDGVAEYEAATMEYDAQTSPEDTEILTLAPPAK
ncbi:carboxypeptidase-like regulatory domain-containing protein [Myxococcota bacterium]|nr:carboxypeptidase-like regulatory domain-containing protein [Myxococcota bacterium]